MEIQRAIFFSFPGKPEFHQDRDPLRVSISREQSFLGGPLDHGPFGHLHPVAQENICGDDSDKAGEKKTESRGATHKDMWTKDIVVLFVMKMVYNFSETI